MKGFSVHIFMPTVEPEGLRVVEKDNWTGQGLVFPRAIINEVKAREELCRPGVYVLWAQESGNTLPQAYVSKSDAVAKRRRPVAPK